MAKYNIADAAGKMGFSPAYVRALVRKGQLATVMEPIVPESLVRRHMISDENIKDFFADAHRGTHRPDGRNKYVVYMTPPEYQAAKTVLTENGLGPVAETIRTWNRLKAPTPAPAGAAKAGKPRKKHAHTIPSV